MERKTWGIPPYGEKDISKDIEGYSTITVEDTLATSLYFVKGDKLIRIEGDNTVYDTEGITHIKDTSIAPEDAQRRSWSTVYVALG